MAENGPTIALGDNGRRCSNKHNPAGIKKPADVFREWAAWPESRPVAENLHHKLRYHDVWLWTGGDIENHLSLTGPKDSSRWELYRHWLANESFAEVVNDNETVTALVQWLTPEGAGV